MRPSLRVVAIVVGFWSIVVAQEAKDPSLQQLYKQHRWFELRDAIAGRTVDASYAGAVASAFNRTADAERDLEQAVREADTTDAATEAREALVNLYMRLGRSSAMIRMLDEALAAAPSRDDFRNVRTLFESFRRLPDQSANPGRHEPFQCEVNDKGVALPLIVNGKAVQWLFDSAFSHTTMSESEARMLGITVSGASALAGDFTGGTAATRAAVAERVVLGGAELRHVPVLVVPDSQPPWNEEAAGRRGTVGLPVVLALQAIRWTKDGTCEVGSHQTRPRDTNGNLAFDGGTPITRALFSGQALDFVLDTGNQGGTQLWDRFARDFPQEVSKGQKSTKQVHQIGGSFERETVVIPELPLRVGGFDTTLRPATLFRKPVGTDFQHGNLGVDVLSRATEVSIDFQAMSLTVR